MTDRHEIAQDGGKSGAAALAPARHADPSRAMTVLRRITMGRYLGVVVGLLVVGGYLAITEPVFLTWDNFVNIIKGNMVMFVLAIGATFVILTAGIDLSVASMAAAAGMVLGLTIDAGWGWIPAVLATLAFGAALGFGNGFLIGKVKISFFVVTLGTLSIYQSFALVVNGGEAVPLFAKAAFQPIKDLVNNDVGPIPLLLVLGLVLLGIAGFVLRYTRYGRAVYAVGSNPEAARLNGVNVTLILVSVYVIAGLTAGMASTVQVGRLTNANATADATLLLSVIAAVLIGGTSYRGGEGGVLGTAIGVLFLGVVQNGLTLSDVTTFWQGMVSGGILILAVGFGELRQSGWRLRRRAPAAPRGGNQHEPGGRSAEGAASG